VRRHHVYLVLWGVFLIALSFIPGRETPVQRFQIDKILHILAFGYMGYLAAVTFGWWGGIIALLFGALNEVQQFIAPGREVAWFDFLANEAGVIAGFLIGFLRRRREVSTG